MSLSHCRVVLVRTHIAGNLGATARVMRNMGFCDLVLVSPLADPGDREARRMSTHGESILERARKVTSLQEATHDCVRTATTSARIGQRIRGKHGPPHRVLPELIKLATTHPVAIVFGPEPSGLTDEEIAHCHDLIHIPCAPDYPALNLAQAVAICLYEARRGWLEQSDALAPSAELLADSAQQHQVFEHLRKALEKLHFLYGPGADALMYSLRHLIGRAQPTRTEIDILHGLARQIEWYVANHPRTLPP